MYRLKSKALLLAALYILLLIRVPSQECKNLFEEPETTGRMADQTNTGSDNVQIILSFAGDVIIGTDESFPYANSLPDIFDRQGGDYAYFFSGVRQLFASDDLTFVNLETPLTTATAMADKTFRFKGEPKYANIIKAGCIEVVNISNNHIYDYLQEGYADTLEILKKSNILFSGEGHVAYVNVKGKTIASLGYSGWDPWIRDRVRNDVET
ncbi:MAG TPA: hypothetical protein DD727_07595, partial [Clostridiales bacterium]|nr:hypothetical protein [Clostridiales bacterium]